MRSLKLASLFMVLGGIALPLALQAQQPARDDVGVYAAVMRSVLDSTRHEIVVMSSMTRPSTGSFNRPVWEVLADQGRDSTMARDFKDRNATPLLMPALEMKGIRTIITEDSVIANLGRTVTDRGVRRSTVEEYWEQFRRIFPGAHGYLLFGGIGYNEEGNEAIVGYSYHCGGLCGNGGVVKLRKMDGKWTIIEQMIGWRA